MSFLVSQQSNVAQDNFLSRLAAQLNQNNGYYGQRENDTGKGPGFMGAIRQGDGVVTEMSVGMDPQPPYRGDSSENGYSYNSIPSVVPTLSPDEIQWLISGNQPTREIQSKAEAFARQRQGQGMPAFRGWQENYQYPRGDK